MRLKQPITQRNYLNMGPAHIFLLHAYADEVYDLVNQKQDSEFETVKREILFRRMPL